MMRNGILAGLFAFGLLAPGLAHAADSATTDDLRCLVVSLTMAGMGGKDLQAAGMMASLYYLGRIDGRSPEFDLENGVIDEILAMKPADLKTAASRCGDALKGRGEELSTLGRHIMERAPKLVPNPVIPN